MAREVCILSRRGFLKLGTISLAGLVLGGSLSGCERKVGWQQLAEAGFRPNVWLIVETSGLVTIFLGKSEMGQGVMTALPMLVAEELEVDMSMVRVMMAPSNSSYGNQLTEGSSSINENWKVLRKAGAAARMMLLAAAAEKWQVPPDECYAENGRVFHEGSGRNIRYRDLAKHAARLSVPENVPLKPAKEFHVIGRDLKRIDVPDKISGRAKYGIDVSLPGMLTAVIAHSPIFGGRVKSYNVGSALSVKGVRHVMEISGGVVVVAEGYWQASEGLKRLELEWVPASMPGTDSTDLFRRYSMLAEISGKIVYEKKGEVSESELKGEITADYQLPFQAHATMEPMNCTAYVHENGCDIWAPTQNPEGARNAAAEYVYGGLRRTLEKIKSRISDNIYPDIAVHKTYIGCGFGRRLEHDFVVEAVQISKKLGVPIKLIWSREEDIRHDFYRPGTYNKVHAFLDGDGLPLKWLHRIVGPEPGLSFGGAENIPYSIPYQRIEGKVFDAHVPIGSWRSTGGALNAFVIESFIDEIAAANAHDPFAFRKRLLDNRPTHRTVLEAACSRAGWGDTLPVNHFQGVALYESRGSIVAQVVEISISGTHKVKVNRVICAVDCGIVVNPDIVRSQLEGGIIFGLGAATKHEVTFRNGAVVESNFDDFPVLRMSDAPEIDIVILPSDRSPAGVGEVAVPPVAPALANAVFSATGRRIRRLPMALENL